MTNASTIDLTAQTVGEIAVSLPQTIRIFETWKIDYCCGGETPLVNACADAGQTVEAFLEALATLAAPDDAARDRSRDTLRAIADDLVATFHVWTREELAALAPLSRSVLSAHGARHPELAEVVALIDALRDDMLPHMLKEEQVLFPYVKQLEDAAAERRAALTPFFGTVKNPVRNMRAEHDRVGELLGALRVVTGAFAPPDDACVRYRELNRRLAELVCRTHEHIHLENNLYFPRAIALEDRAGAPATFSNACGAKTSR